MKMCVGGLSYEAAERNPKGNYYDVLNHEDEFEPLHGTLPTEHGVVHGHQRQQMMGRKSYAVVTQKASGSQMAHNTTDLGATRKTAKSQPVAKHQWEFGPKVPITNNKYACKERECLQSTVEKLQAMVVALSKRLTVVEGQAEKTGNTKVDEQTLNEGQQMET